MKKLLSVTLVIIMLIMSLSLSFTAGAEASPYSRYFTSEEEMLASLRAYAEAFPDVEDYELGDLSETPAGHHLAEKKVVIPYIDGTDYKAQSYSFAEDSYGIGVNYTFTSYSKGDTADSVRILVYYDLLYVQIKNALNKYYQSVSPNNIIDGKVSNKYNYIGYNEYSDDVFTRSVYKVALDDKLVIIYSEDTCTKAFMNNIKFEETDIILPVYETEPVLPEVPEGYNRLFFLMPEDWFNEYSEGVGIYWWEGTDAASSWPGYKAHKADTEGVYYYDVPKDVPSIIWNNYVSLFLEEFDEGQWANKQTAAPKEWDENKVDLNDCNGKIYVIDPDKTETNPFSGKKTYYGDWYTYLGDGDYEITPEVIEGYNRYYFYMPEEWKNEYTDTAGIYWWEGSETPDEWPGYEAHKADAGNVYYYDVPRDVTLIIWNNFVDGGVDPKAEIYKYAVQTKNICTEFYFPEESDFYPEGVESFDNMIYVTDPYYNPVSQFNGKLTFWGEWFYYYGNGEYGTAPDKADSRVYTDVAPDLEKMFEESTCIVGDADDNGSLNVRDATTVQKHIAGLESDIFTKPADADRDEKLTIRDATLIQKHLASLDINSEVGESIRIYDDVPYIYM